MRAGVVALSALLALLACGSKKSSPGATGSPPPASTAALELPPLVPASAILLVSFDAPADWFSDFAAVSGMSAADAHAMRDDLALYFKKTTGLELAGVHRGTIFATPGDQGALIVRDVGGEWKAPLPGDDVAVARWQEYLIVGAKPAVEAALAVASGKQPGLAKDAPLAMFFARESAGASFAIAADVEKLPIPEVQGRAAVFGVTHAFIALGGGRIRVVAHGDGKKLAEMVTMLETQLAAAAKMLETQKAQVLEGASVEKGVDPEALGIVVGAHTAKHLAASFHPKVEGNDLRLDMTFESPGAAVFIAGVGVMAAVAIPAFTKYMRKATSTEATQGIKRIYDGARTYYLERHKMPPAIALTPAAGACCGQPDDKCVPDDKQWAEWKAIGFLMDEPYRYSYQLDADATGFTARAIGDLDCDGTYSTFEMAATIAADGSLEGAAGVYKNHELE